MVSFSSISDGFVNNRYVFQKPKQPAPTSAEIQTELEQRQRQDDQDRLERRTLLSEIFPNTFTAVNPFEVSPDDVPDLFK